MAPGLLRPGDVPGARGAIGVQRGPLLGSLDRLLRLFVEATAFLATLLMRRDLTVLLVVGVALLGIQGEMSALHDNSSSRAT